MAARSSLMPREAFTTRFLAGVPTELAASFTPGQLAAVQLAFGMRYAMDHTLDVRRTVGLPWGRFYLVLLVGRDRRREDRSRPGRRGWMGRAMILGGAAASVALVVRLLVA